MTAQYKRAVYRWFPERYSWSLTRGSFSTVGNRRHGGTTLKRAALMVAIFVVSILAATAVEAADFHVITHPSLGIDSISKRDLIRIFFKQRTRWATGTYAKPIDQKMKNEVREDFSAGVLNRSLADVESYWNSQVFSGKSTPPPTARTDQEVLDFVKNTPGAVGYISVDASTIGVQVVTVVD